MSHKVTFHIVVEGAGPTPVFAMRNVIGCVCCGNDHQDLPWMPMARPIEIGDEERFTHWLLCPDTGSPILSRIATT